MKDKRRVTPDSPATETNTDELELEEPSAASVEAEVVEVPAEPDYLQDLQRLQAEFDNYRKRMMRQNADASSSGAARVVERLLPVLDNFELAIAHGEGGAGVEMVFKELKTVLEAAGLTEVPGEGAPFDPQIHEAVDYREDESVTEDTVRTVHRRGYTMNDRLLRAAMVGVVRPPEAPPAEADEE